MSNDYQEPANRRGARGLKGPLILILVTTAALSPELAGSAVADPVDVVHATRSTVTVSIRNDKLITANFGNGKGISTTLNSLETGQTSCPQLSLSTIFDPVVVIKANPDISYETFLGVAKWVLDCRYQTLRVNISTAPDGQPQLMDLNVGFSTAFLCRPGACPKAPEFISLQYEDKIFVSEGHTRLKPTTLNQLAIDLPIAIGSKTPHEELLYIRADRDVKYRRFQELVSTLRLDGYDRLAVIPESYGATVSEHHPAQPPLLAMRRASRPTTTIANLDWAQKPTAGEVAQYYPELAQRTGIEGNATVSCQIEADGSLRDCELVSEEPADRSFGQAALKLTAFFKMKPATYGGQSIAGTIVNIPIGFRLPKASPAASGSGAATAGDGTTGQNRSSWTGPPLKDLGWTYRGESPNQPTAYFTRHADQPSGPLRRIWVRIEISEPNLIKGYSRPDGTLSRSFVALVEFDCQKSRDRYVNQTFYTGNNLEGVSVDADVSRFSWYSALRGTYLNTFERELCSDGSPPA